MTIEMVMARGWRMWVNGKSTGPFDIGENDDYSYDLTGTSPVWQQVHAPSRIQFDVPELEWSSTLKPTCAVVDGRRMTVTACTWGTEEGIVKVQMMDGETVELDEITAYVKLEGC